MLQWAFTQFNNISRSLAVSGILSSRPGQQVGKNFPKTDAKTPPQPVTRAVRSLLQAEVGTLHFLSCLRHNQVLMPRMEPGPQHQPALILWHKGLTSWYQYGATRGAVGRRGTNHHIPISGARGEEAQHHGHTFSLCRRHRCASCMRTALLQRAGEEQSQVQASGTGDCLSRNST